MNWDELNLPDYENVEETNRRLNEIHKELLLAKGLSPVPEKNSPGFEPTAYQARQVAVMSCLGLSSRDIALVLNIEEKMLTVYYKKELKVSHNLANAMVARVALQMAMSGRFPDMTKFWLKTQAGWKDAVAAPVTEDNKEGDLDSAKSRLRRAIAPQLPAPNNTPKQ